MYEYTPARKKTRELITALLLVGIAIAIYSVSQIPKLPYPALFQLVAVFFLVGAVLIVTRFVMRQFTFRVERTEEGAMDLVVVERYGRRLTTVCRISVDRIRMAERPIGEKRRVLAEKKKGKRVYRYTAEFFAPDLCIVETGADDAPDGESIFLEICADETLFSILNAPKRNICLPNNEK